MDGSTLYVVDATFPFLLGGTFIEAEQRRSAAKGSAEISLPFGRDFH